MAIVKAIDEFSMSFAFEWGCGRALRHSFCVLDQRRPTVHWSCFEGIPFRRMNWTFAAFSFGDEQHVATGENRVDNPPGTFRRASSQFVSAGWLRVALILLFCAQHTHAVCGTCFGSVNGCAGTTNACPLLTGVAANAAALVVSSAAVLSLVKLLPGRILRVFSRPLLEALVAIAQRPTGGEPYDFTGKSAFDIQKAVTTGLVTAAEAGPQLYALLHALPEDSTALTIQKIQTAIETVRAAPSSRQEIPHAGEDSGALLYTLGKITEATCQSVKNFTICLPVEPDKPDGAGKTSGRAVSVRRPTTSEQCMSALNQWVMVCHATGLANVLVLTPFLDEVFYEPLRNGEVSDHRVAFELVILYLQMIVTSDGVYTLADVYVKSGGVDVARRRAEAAVVEIFRAHGGIPVGKSPKNNNLANVTVSAFTSTGKHCLAYNLGTAHKPFALMPDGRTCRFNHRCDQFVKEKGPDGRCDGSHPRADCDYPSAQRGKP